MYHIVYGNLFFFQFCSILWNILTSLSTNGLSNLLHNWYTGHLLYYDNHACQIETGSVYFVIRSKPTGAQVNLNVSFQRSSPEPTMI